MKTPRIRTPWEDRSTSMTPIPQPYPHYKPSAVEWHGDVPEHWETIRISAVARGGPESFTDGDWVEIPHITDSGVRLIQTGNVGIGIYREQGFRYVNEQSFNELSCTEVNPGDVLICRLANPVGRACLAPDLGIRMITSVDVCILKPSERFSAQYLVFLLSSQVYLDYVASIVRGGTRDRISRSMLAAIKITNPPLPEQRAIVRYLDHVDGRIRRYVSAKEKLIALLEEERQAVIHHAVTRGLDPNVPLKPSGVQWLGDVPAHWEVWRLGYLATKFGSGITPRGGATVYQESGVPFLRSQNIHFGGLRMQDVARIPPSLHGELSSSHVKPGDVLLNITGASIGRVCSVPDDFVDGNVNQHVCIIRPKRSHIRPNLLAAYLSIPMMQREIQVEQSGASREGLTLQSIRNFRVLVPPLSEQTAIVEHLDKTTANIDAAIARARRQIELLREYRTRIIADVVTGKLDVRETAATLPDEARQ